MNMKFWQKLNEILVKTRIIQETPFFYDRGSNWKPGRRNLCKILRRLYMKFYLNLVRGFEEMDLGRRADGRRTEGWTEGRTDEAVTKCSPFGKRNKLYNYEVSCNFDKNWMRYMYIRLVKIGILQETPFFHDRASNWKSHRLNKPRVHGETFNKHYSHEFSWNFDKNWMRY